MGKGRKIQTTGAIFCESIKQRTQEINKLRKMYQDVKIQVIDDMVMYDVFEYKESNMVQYF